MSATTKYLLTAIVVLALMSLGCRERESDDGPPAQPRDRLTLTELIRSEYQGTAPLDNRYFMPMGTREAAKHEVEGTLIVPEFVMHNSGEEADSTDPRRGQDQWRLPAPSLLSRETGTFVFVCRESH